MCWFLDLLFCLSLPLPPESSSAAPSSFSLSSSANLLLLLLLLLLFLLVTHSLEETGWDGGAAILGAPEACFNVDNLQKTILDYPRSGQLDYPRPGQSKDLTILDYPRPDDPRLS